MSLSEPSCKPLPPFFSRWEPGTYRTLVVYVTHGLSGTRNYQIADNLEAGPIEVS